MPFFHPFYNNMRLQIAEQIGFCQIKNLRAATVQHGLDHVEAEAHHLVHLDRGRHRKFLAIDHDLQQSLEHHLDRARLIGVQTGSWAETMVQQRGPIGTRVLHGLLALAQKHPVKALEAAAQTALHHGTWRLRDLRALLAQERRRARGRDAALPRRRKLHCPNHQVAADACQNSLSRHESNCHGQLLHKANADESGRW